MYFFFVSANLMYWMDFGFPANVVLPILWVGSVAAEMFLQICFQEKKHKRRLLTYVALAMCVVCEMALWMIQSYTAMAFYVSYHIAVTVLCASLVGKLGYRVMEAVSERRSKKEN